MLAGDAELGSTFLSEIVPVKGVRSAGALGADREPHRLCGGHHDRQSQWRGSGGFIAVLAARGSGRRVSFGFEPAPKPWAIHMSCDHSPPPRACQTR